MSDSIEDSNYLIDCHNHLAAFEFYDDLDDVIERSKTANVKACLVVPEFYSEFSRILHISRLYPDFIMPFLGLHPTQNVNNCLTAEGLQVQRSVSLQDTKPALEFIAEHVHSIHGIGEVGLDFTPPVCKKEDRDIQRQVFSDMIDAALQYNLPLNVHSRSAGNHVIELLKQKNASRVLLHAFDGKVSTAISGVREGFYFSVPPSIIRSEQKQKIFKEIPLQNICLETDSPALSAEKGTRNEPANAFLSCKCISELKCIPFDEVARVTTNNAFNLFPTIKKLL